MDDVLSLLGVTGLSVLQTWEEAGGDLGDHKDHIESAVRMLFEAVSTDCTA
jgi:hypothetical protein